MPNRWATWLQNLGRDGWDEPLSIPEDMSGESVNIELRVSGLGTKRQGTVATNLESGGGVSIGNGGIFNVAKFVPGNDQGLMELFFLTPQAAPALTYTLWRLPGTRTSAVSLATDVLPPASFAQLNGKFFYTTSKTVNRLSVYAPNESTTTVRLAGLIPEGAPTVGNTGAGTYPAVIRFYRTIVKRIVSSKVVSQSNPSVATQFTPSGGGTAARVTRAAVTGEGETHWCVEAASASGLWWQISGDIAIATTTYDDTVEPINYPDVGTVPPEFGSNFPFPGTRYLISDGVRLYGLGTYQTSAGNSVPPQAGRLYMTPAYGSSDMGDDERIIDTETTSLWIDVSIGGGGDDRGLGGPINNAIVALQFNRVVYFIPTGNPDTPVRRVDLSDGVGSMSGASVVRGEDGVGRPCLYFLNPLNGPYRFTADYQLEWLGKDVKDLWNTVTISGTDFETAFWGVYDNNRKLVIWQCGTAGPMLVFDVTIGQLVRPNEVRRGFVQWQRPASKTVNSGVMFSEALTVPRSPRQTLLYGSSSALTTGTSSVLVTSATATTDDGTAYQAYMKSRAFWWDPMGRLKKVLEMVIVAKARAATMLRITQIRNWGETEQTHDVSIAPDATEIYVRPRANPVDQTALETFQLQIGDAAAVDNTWAVTAAELQIQTQEEMR